MPLIYPNEVWPSEASVAALDGTTDAATGLPYIAKGTGPTSVPSYEVQYNRRQARQNAVLAPWRALQVVSEGGLRIGVYPGGYTLGGARRTFDGATDQAVPDDATRFVYLDANGDLQIAASEPGDLTTFLPLAEVVTASGAMTIRDRRLLAALHVPQLDGPVAPENLSAALRAMFTACTIAVGTESGNNIDVTLQMKDAAGDDLAERRFARVWLSDTAPGGVSGSIPNGGFSVLTGTKADDYGPGVHMLAMSDANGVLVLRITPSGAATWYLVAEIGGRVFVSSALTYS